MKPTNKQPLFIITGASCVGKSTLCDQLFANEKYHWLKRNANVTSPCITLLDTTELSPVQAAKIVHNWMIEKII